MARHAATIRLRDAGALTSEERVWTDKVEELGGLTKFVGFPSALENRIDEQAVESLITAAEGTSFEAEAKSRGKAVLAGKADKATFFDDMDRKLTSVGHNPFATNAVAVKMQDLARDPAQRAKWEAAKNPRPNPDAKMPAEVVAFEAARKKTRNADTIIGDALQTAIGKPLIGVRDAYESIPIVGDSLKFWRQKATPGDPTSFFNNAGSPSGITPEGVMRHDTGLMFPFRPPQPAIMPKAAPAPPQPQPNQPPQNQPAGHASTGGQLEQRFDRLIALTERQTVILESMGLFGDTLPNPGPGYSPRRA